jgi:hypothetical protein
LADRGHNVCVLTHQSNISHLRCHAGWRNITVGTATSPFQNGTVEKIQFGGVYVVSLPIPVFERSPDTQVFPSITNNDGKEPEIPDVSSEFDLDLILNVLQAVCSKHLFFNLFSVCGYHIAEMLDIPCGVISPSFSAASLKVLKREKGSGQNVENDKGVICHWMSPLFQLRYQKWRKLHMRPTRTEDECTDIFTETRYFDRHCNNSIFLYGFSGFLLAPPEHWPVSVAVCGCWMPRKIPKIMLSAFAHKHHHSLSHFLEDGTRPVLFTFGSMAHLGLTPSPEKMQVLLSMTFEMLANKGLRAIFVGPEEYVALCTQPSLENMVITVANYVDFEWLFPKCAVIVSHGGSGTVHAAVQAAVPQVICPVAFDQKTWGDRLHQLGLATFPLPMWSRTFCAKELSERILEAAEPSTSVSVDMDRVQKYSKILAEEGETVTQKSIFIVERWLGAHQ